MSFVHPALLFGALLFTVPLIIHLLNRQRFRRRDWAAMEFLLLAYKKQRRRLRTENLLLLILRCLIPIILAFAIARPMLRDSIGPQLGGSAHHVLVLDGSYSMGLRPENAQSPHDVMKELAGELIDRLEGGGNKITLALAGIRTTMPIRDEMNLGRVKDKIAQLGSPQDSAQDLIAALSQVADMLEDGADAESVVYVFTDMQTRAFGDLTNPPGVAPAAAPDDPAVPSGPDPTLFADTSRDIFARIAERAEVVLIDVGRLALDSSPAQADNAQIVGIRLDTTLAIAKNPLPLVATVLNRSAVARSLQVQLELEGEQTAVRTLELEAGAEGDVEFPVLFQRTGLRHLRVSLEGDGLAADNERFMVVRVRDRLRLLVVEGSEETDPGLLDSELIRSRLDPTRGEGDARLTTYAPEVVDTVQFLAGQANLRDYDIVVLCNLDRLNETAARALKDAMLAGTSLWVLLGDRTDPASFNLHLHRGDGPMPIRLDEMTGYQPLGDQAYQSTITTPDHPVFRNAFLEDVYYRAFELTPIYRYFLNEETEEDDDAAARRGQVLARVRDAKRSALIVASHHGAGKAMFWTSGLSERPDRWNRFDVDIMSFPLVFESVNWLALPQNDDHNIAAGDEITTTLRHRPTDVAVLLPERAGGGKVLVGGDSQRRPGGIYTLPAFRGTEFAGVYNVEMVLEGADDETVQRMGFAANADPIEGELSYLSHRAAREQLGVKTILRRLPSDRSAAIHTGISDFGIPLLWAALFFVLSEALLARMVSRRRS